MCVLQYHNISIWVLDYVYSWAMNKLKNFCIKTEDYFQALL